MSNILGVTITEKDQSKTTSALDVPKGAIAVYAVKGRTDRAVLCRDENTIQRNFGNPKASMVLGGGNVDLNRGLHTAFAMVRAGKPTYVMRAIPTVVAGVKATADLMTDAVAAITATALGHGLAYNGDATNLGYSVFIGGIELISMQVAIVNGATLSLADVVMPKTFRCTGVSGTSGSGNDTIVTGATKTIANGGIDITITYENPLYSNFTTIKNNGGATIYMQIIYERTTTQRLCRLYICNYGETDPKNSYLESYLVSFKSSGVDEAGRGVWVEDVVNDTSEICTISVNSAYDQTTRILGTKPDLSDIIQFAGGTDGTYVTYKNGETDVATAYSEFKKKADYDITLVCDAGYAGAVKAMIAETCRVRLFAHGYIDPPRSYFVDVSNTTKNSLVASTLADQLVKWRMNGDTGEPLTIASTDGEFVSIAGCSWGLISDEFNSGRKLWMGPSYEVIQNAVTVIDTLGPWNSVMGPRRGITGFEKLAVNIYEYRNSLNVKQVNPLIIDERGVQMFYGNKTCKSVASAMQQSHARITRSLMSREFYFAALDYIAEGIVDSTYNDLRDEFEIIIEKYSPALESYSLVVGPPKTTAADINNQILRIGVGLIFNQIAEEINITTTVFRNGETIDVSVV